MLQNNTGDQFHMDENAKVEYVTMKDGVRSIPHDLLMVLFCFPLKREMAHFSACNVI